MCKYFSKSFYNFFIPVIECSGTAYPEKIFRFFTSCKEIGHYRDFNFTGFHFLSLIFIANFFRFYPLSISPFAFA